MSIVIAHEETASERWLAMGPECIGALMLILGWCDSQRSDGTVRREVVTRRLGIRARTLSKLIELGELRGEAGALHVVHYSRYCQSRATIEERRAQERQKKQRQRATKHHEFVGGRDDVPAGHGGDSPGDSPGTDPQRPSGVPHPVPSRTVPSPYPYPSPSPPVAATPADGGGSNFADRLRSELGDRAAEIDRLDAWTSDLLSDARGDVDVALAAVREGLAVRGAHSLAGLVRHRARDIAALGPHARRARIDGGRLDGDAALFAHENHMRERLHQEAAEQRERAAKHEREGRRRAPQCVPRDVLGPPPDWARTRARSADATPIADLLAATTTDDDATPVDDPTDASSGAVGSTPITSTFSLNRRS